MTTAQYLRLALITNDGVRAIVGERVYSEFSPQSSDPQSHIVFDEVAGEDDLVTDGPNGGRTAGYQVISKARKRADATALGMAVKKALNGHRGGAAGLSVGYILFVSEAWDYDPDPPGLYEVVQQFEIASGGESA